MYSSKITKSLIIKSVMLVIIMMITIRVTAEFFSLSFYMDMASKVTHLLHDSPPTFIDIVLSSFIMFPLFIVITILIIIFFGFGMWNLMNYLFSISGLIEEEEFDKDKLNTYHKTTMSIKKMRFIDVIKNTSKAVFFAIVGIILMLIMRAFEANISRVLSL